MDSTLLPTESSTCAVVVTHYPDEDILERLCRIQKQLPAIIIVDNASDATSLSILRKFSISPTVTLIENTENEGLGKALNQAASLALKSGYLWILTLDQDTCINEKMFVTLAAIYRDSSPHSPLIGSNYNDLSRKKPFLRHSPDAVGNYSNRRTVITSGTLMKLDLITTIGGFREDYFIDSIDHEYCLRARANGHEVLISRNCLMSHTIGQPGGYISLLLAFDHPPVRKYYISRNTLVTLMNYFTREPVWASRQIARLFVELLSIVLVERRKLEKARAFSLGICDALRKKMGRCEWSV